MLIKFTEFIIWPEKAFKSNPDKFVIGVLGNPKIFRLLTSQSGREIQGRRLHVISMTQWSSDTDIQMIYLDASALEKHREEIRTNTPAAVLTISDSEAFLGAGGMLSFIPKRSGRLGFAVNLTVQKESSLVFSSALLRLAIIYTNEGKRGNND